ncbi:MAG TPA: hypothetical protein VF786_13035 [Terriglobales bacterium]
MVSTRKLFVTCILPCLHVVLCLLASIGLLRPGHDPIYSWFVIAALDMPFSLLVISRENAPISLLGGGTVWWFLINYCIYWAGNRLSKRRSN